MKRFSVVLSKVPFHYLFVDFLNETVLAYGLWLLFAWQYMLYNFYKFLHTVVHFYGKKFRPILTSVYFNCKRAAQQIYV